VTRTTAGKRRRGNGGVGQTGENQQQVFTGLPNALEIRQTAPDFHIPTATTAVNPCQPKDQKNERKPAAARPPHPDLFQDHVALETLARFRIIRRLENASKTSNPEPPSTKLWSGST
jgi:hypothetical protein